MKIKQCLGSVLLVASIGCAEVTVNFVNTLATNKVNGLQTLTLEFSVDASGNVTLDASATGKENVDVQPHVQDAIDAWDGPVGTISYTGAFNTQFSLILSPVGGDSIRLSAEGNGLGIGGSNAWKIDNMGKEHIVATAIISNGKLDFHEVRWNNMDAKCMMTMTCPNGTSAKPLDSVSGSWAIKGSIFELCHMETIELEAECQSPSGGYSLAGFSFDVLENKDPVTLGFLPVGMAEKKYELL